MILSTPDPVLRRLTEVAMKAVCYLALKGEDSRQKQIAVVFINRRAMQLPYIADLEGSLTGVFNDVISHVLEAAPHMFSVTAIQKIPPRSRTLIGTNDIFGFGGFFK